MNIRQEESTDFSEIYTLVKTAFESAAMAEGDEQDYVEKIRAGSTYLPEFSLVAELDGVIIGHIMLAKTKLRSRGQVLEHLVLAILSVAEDGRSKGIGTALTSTALDRAKQKGYRAIFVAGYCNYYCRFGFVPASQYGIRYKEDVPAEMVENIMALELAPGALSNSPGIVDL